MKYHLTASREFLTVVIAGIINLRIKSKSLGESYPQAIDSGSLAVTVGKVLGA